MTSGDDLLAGFPVIVEIPVWWGEMDAFQHLNNTVYFRHFETARVAYFERLDVDGTLRQSGIIPILASTRCEFRKPLSYPDTVRVGCRTTEIGVDRIVSQLRTVSVKLGKIAAEGEALLIAYDLIERRRAASLPAEARARIEALEGRTFREAPSPPSAGT